MRVTQSHLPSRCPDKWVTRHSRRCPPGGGVSSGPRLWPCPPCPQRGGATAETWGSQETPAPAPRSQSSPAPSLEAETVTLHATFADVMKGRFWRLREIILDYPHGP